jgi:NADP-dependent 3-hydroxy acid dehydrogenase YdfG
MTMLLSGFKALIAGATGEVGKGAAVALWQSGAEVWIAGRSEAKLQEIKSSLMNDDDKVHILPADYSTVQGAQQLESMLPPEHFDVVVASSGPWWPVNKLYDADLDTFEKAMKANVHAQLLLYRVLVKRTKKHYIVVNGSAAIALPQTTLTGICANSVVGFARVAHAECEADPTLPLLTHALVSSSVGHGQLRSHTNDPVAFGRTFVAMALGKHTLDSTGTILVNDEAFQALVKQL